MRLSWRWVSYGVVHASRRIGEVEEVGVVGWWPVIHRSGSGAARCVRRPSVSVALPIMTLGLHRRSHAIYCRYCYCTCCCCTRFAVARTLDAQQVCR